MRKLILFMTVAAFIFTPWMGLRAGAGQNKPSKPAHAKHHHTKHHHQKHHKKS